MVQFKVDGDRDYLKYKNDMIDNPKMQKNIKQIPAGFYWFPEPEKNMPKLLNSSITETGTVMVKKDMVPQKS